MTASTTRKIERFVDLTYQNDFMKSVHKLRQNEEYTDVTLQSSDVQIQCHRVVLAIASDYFKALFRCDHKENVLNPVQLTMEPDILTSIVDYIYTGEIEVTVDNVESLIKACDVIQLDGLKAGCEDFMVAQVDLFNCVGFYRFAVLYRLQKILMKAKRLMFVEFKAVAFTDQFKELSCSELVEFIKDDDISVEDEDVVFESVVDWVRHDIGKRKSSLKTVLEHVRLPHCTSNYLWHMKETCDLLTPKCVEYLHEAFRFQADTSRQHQISSCRTVPRTNFRKKSSLLVVGGLTCSKNSPCVNNKLCQYYNEDTGCWESLTEMPQSVGRLYSVCYVGRSLLLTGGSNGDAVDQCCVYDLVTKKWEAMPPLITARRYHRSVTLGDCVYVVGGKGVGDNNVLASVECLDFERRQWSSIPDMPQAVTDPMVVTSGNKMFVFGGQDAQGVTFCCTQVFDSTRVQWSSQSDSPEPCCYGAAVTLDNCVYVVGGFNRTCLKYDPATDAWTRLSQPREKHGNAPAVVWRGCILVTGGGGPKPESSVIEKYDPLTDTWSDWKTTLDMKLASHGVLNVDVCV